MVEGSRRRRPRRSGVEAEQLAQLTARRDALDQEQVRRREREDEALAQYAAAVARVQAINDERDRRAADLAKQLTQLHDQAKADVAAVEREQAAALVVLNELGRSADDLAKLTGVSVKRVRAMLRAARPQSSARRQPSASRSRAGAKATGDQRELASSRSESAAEGVG
jgi:DNA-directed RNA polymerase specialized sigma24 family protein